MRNLVSVNSISIMLLFSLFILACDKSSVGEIQHTSEVVEITLDLEDYLYNYGNEWHRINHQSTDCELTFEVQYTLTDNILRIVFCSIVGEVAASSVLVGNDDCGTWETTGDSFLLNEDKREFRIPINEDLRSCMIDKNDWLEIKFEFLFN